ncbi:hypothetical protein P153DRAFT_394875 [Dothidotthia symphoricarpi CBS 119687]|uniref:Uncharacterized protein n=1 Tax=Dothidotthia symphoricarpi CBS 119687 TaxID=1392245 RepID=A0A6A6AKD1_9PLEO|nr:uncharacterized protein P153DRAFT_394875 [Dothidotthia symphoricarpi CBS 119687]KAF2131555.1 hypothetical protein P153DRAFT_394875 [Dothidotthia symphoricarpi CBS 119687]
MGEGRLGRDWDMLARRNASRIGKLAAHRGASVGRSSITYDLDMHCALALDRQQRRMGEAVSRDRMRDGATGTRHEQETDVKNAPSMCMCVRVCVCACWNQGRRHRRPRLQHCTPSRLEQAVGGSAQRNSKSACSRETDATYRVLVASLASLLPLPRFLQAAAVLQILGYSAGRGSERCSAGEDEGRRESMCRCCKQENAI